MSATQKIDDANPSLAAPQNEDSSKPSSKIGTFQLSSLIPDDPAFTPLLYRLREETFHNRTVQLRHGSYLKRFTKDPARNLRKAISEAGINLDDFMSEYGLTGCIVVQDGAIRLEEYRHGNTPASRNDIQSITKSFVSTLMAIAQQEGKLSVNDPVSRYVEELKDTAWADITLRALASMSSGVVEQSDDPRPADVPNPYWATHLYPSQDPNAVLEWFKTFRKVAEPWEEFHYYNPNYYALSKAISRAVGEPLEDYLSRKIWDPAGMQYDGYLRTTAAGTADGHGGLSITLSDMARFGSFVLEDFKTEGAGPSVPKGWFQEISEGRTSTGPRAPGVNGMVSDFGYETGWWVPAREGHLAQLAELKAFGGTGMYGQSLMIIPKLQTVVAIQSGYHDGLSSEVYSHNARFTAAIASIIAQGK
ncbi:unnamed protein product [Clonostachys byssicola]|uniref:Beta-lactamase-related domain-containing protein n=1 Tax=Clonostachys byssicola TaxID=160290 RepID=A0A9N9UMD5_9HYPO|nr:unnamed protein product [Clonostachys byssicola]